MSEARAVTVIQAGMRGLIARRAVEVQRCRLDLRAALSDAKERPGEPHPEVTQTMMDLGEAYLRAWDRDSAEQAYSVALQSIEREYGVGDPRARKPAHALARIYEERGDEALAQEVLARAFAPKQPPLEASSVEEGPTALDGALAAVSATLGSWLTAEG